MASKRTSSGKSGKAKKPAGELEGSAEATQGRPRQVDTARAAILAMPPDPTEEQLAERERCIAGTHKIGRSLPPGDRPRGAAESMQPDVPPTSPSD